MACQNRNPCSLATAISSSTLLAKAVSFPSSECSLAANARLKASDGGCASLRAIAIAALLCADACSG